MNLRWEQLAGEEEEADGDGGGGVDGDGGGCGALIATATAAAFIAVVLAAAYFRLVTFQESRELPLDAQKPRGLRGILGDLEGPARSSPVRQTRA